MPADELPPPTTKITGDSDHHDAEFTTRGCSFCCFRQWKRMRKSSEAADEYSDHTEKWWWSTAMKIREWSEITAGPKWKTFIRRFKKNRFKMNGADFRYDPMSYALNFDETAIQSSNCSESENPGRHFSARYASIPASVNLSIGR